jgi:putative alpha-1,2-mannosidase
LAGKPCKTAELVNQICKTKYQDNVDGLCGNDDCGQMSAWYIFSTMGFYPVNPCGGDYVLGAPQLPGATIRLANGKSFTMETDNYGAKNIYVKSVELNGAKYDKKSIRHQDIISGSTLKFYMTDVCGTK